jgi:Zn-dependent protease with chaperone function
VDLRILRQLEIAILCDPDPRDEVLDQRSDAKGERTGKQGSIFDISKGSRNSSFAGSAMPELAAVSAAHAADNGRAEQELLGALARPIAPVRAGLAYRIGLLLGALVMLLLPLIYMALVGVVVYAVYWHTVHDISIFETGGASRGKLLAYLGPILIGGILIVFMIKPLFARKRRKTHPLSLSRIEEPRLFAFVDRLCQVVGAPTPRRIDVDTAVNASASFEEGIVGFLRRDLVLTIGLPLVAGLSLRQLTGVLAHEFGHFAQGTGMRLTYLIRRINGWFARVVYERDSWDDWLTEQAQEGGNWLAALIVALARFFIWLTRWVLWALMLAAHFVSSFMLRQMEFDADRYEARVAGSETFVQTAEKLVALNAAADAAFSDLSSAWQERRLCDDLPALIRWREADMPQDVRSTVTKHTRARPTGWFDTHPSDADRIASARRENTPGVFLLDAPASALFHDFKDLSRRATVAFYHQQLEGIVKPENLMTTDSLVAERGRKRQNLQALKRYFQDLVHPVRPVFPERIVAGVTNQSAAAEMLLDLRTQFVNAASDALHAAVTFAQADANLVSVARVRALKNACVKKIDPAQHNLKNIDEATLIAVAQQAAAERGGALDSLNQVLTLGMQRMELALSLNVPVRRLPPEPRTPAEDYGEYEVAAEPQPGSDDRVADAMRCLASVSPLVENVRQQFYVLGALLAELSPDNNAEELIGAILSASRKMCNVLSQIYSSLSAIPYPYEHVEKQVTLAGYALNQIPPPDAVGPVFSTADSMLEAIYSLYMRILSDMSRRAEAIEESFGLAPLHEPVNEPELPAPV